MRAADDQPRLYRSLLSFDLADPSGQVSFEARLASDSGWTLGYATQVCHEYRRFLCLIPLLLLTASAAARMFAATGRPTALGVRALAQLAEHTRQLQPDPQAGRQREPGLAGTASAGPPLTLAFALFGTQAVMSMDHFAMGLYDVGSGASGDFELIEHADDCQWFRFGAVVAPACATAHAVDDGSSLTRHEYHAK